MKKWLESPKIIFGALWVLAFISIVVGLVLSVYCGVVQFLTQGENAPGVGYAVTALLNGMLWWISWGSFMGICSRLMHEESAFTVKNSQALQVIGKSVLMMAAVMCLRSMPELLVQPDPFLLIEALILPGVFMTVSMLAFILSRLLDHAMALEQEQADVV